MAARKSAKSPSKKKESHKQSAWDHSPFDQPQCTKKGIVVPCMPLWLFAKFVWYVSDHPFELPSLPDENEISHITVFDGWIVCESYCRQEDSKDSYYAVERICRVPDGYSVKKLHFDFKHFPKMTGLWIGPHAVMECLDQWDGQISDVRKNIIKLAVKFWNPDYDINRDMEEIPSDVFHAGCLKPKMI